MSPLFERFLVFTTSILVICSSCNLNKATFLLEHSAPIVRAGKLTEAIGIRTIGGVFTTIIQRDENVPASKSEVFSTAADNQNEIKIHVYRGNRPLARQNTHVGSFQVVSIPPAKAGRPQIEIMFRVSSHGDISVEATDLGTHSAAEIRKISEGAV
jgi:molecular chaperone DnaK (HSP70)